MVLTEKHYKCIELLMKGLKYTEIAKKVPCSRQSIYDWLKDDDFSLALDKSTQEIKTQTNNKVLAKIDTYVDKIEQLAENSASDTVKLNALTFLYETVMGKASSKVEQTITTNNKEDNDIVDLDSYIHNLPNDNTIMDNDNVIDIEEAKKAN